MARAARSPGQHRLPRCSKLDRTGKAPDLDRDALRSELKQLMIEELDLRDRDARQIADDQPLFGEGLGLDSLDALQLAMAIEERFGVRVPEGEAARPVFASVSALAEYIATSRAA